MLKKLAFLNPSYLRLVASIVTLAGFYSASVQAISLRDAIEQAAQTNPAVQATWEAFEASSSGVRAAKGGYYPKVDLVLERGRENIEDPLQFRQSLDTENYNLTVTQMLFDGFATKQEVAKQSYFRLARYYEFRQASEDIALETAEAYLDILHYRSLVQLAKENYDQHLRYYTDIEERVGSGIGRGVDLHQASARLALSESNVLTETTNLHDVSARYYRLVGSLPPVDLDPPFIEARALPANRTEALRKAFNSSPQLNAAIENIRVTRADLKAKNSPMMPRFDLRLYKQLDENDRNTIGRYEEEGIELVMTYNLYNGGSDKARKRQSKSLMYEATAIRDRVCRDVRQTVSIAYNDIKTKSKLISYLERNEKAISKAREAYKNQFDIGQRTLLDLLDTENEYFEVKRTLVSAKKDRVVAELRTLAGMGKLLYSMKIDGLDEAIADELDLSREDSLNAKCPAIAPKMAQLDIKKVARVHPLNKKTLRLSNRETVKLDLKFANGSSELVGGSEKEILRAATLLCTNKNMNGVVEGHTDSRGAASYNLNLSQARADTVKAALIESCPEANARLTSVGFGGAHPIARNDSAAGRAENRRVELVLEKKK